MKEYKKPYILSESRTHGFIPAAIAAATGVTSAAATTGIAVGKAAFAAGVAAGLMKDKRFDIPFQPALEPVT